MREGAYGDFPLRSQKRLLPWEPRETPGTQRTALPQGQTLLTLLGSPRASREFQEPPQGEEGEEPEVVSSTPTAQPP